MSAREALRAARAVGVEFAVNGADLSLKAPSEPPAAILEALRRHKPEIAAMLRPGRDGWSAEDWRLYFEERAAIAEFYGGLPRDNAEAQAFECCVVKWLDGNPAPSAPGCCAWCSRTESHDVVVPYGTEPGTHTWLHRECWSAWHLVRRSQAQQTLNRMGLRNPSDDCIVHGGCTHPSDRT
jgi:hypothetical protein